MRKFLVMLGLALSMSGCASVTRGTEDSVVFDSDPPGAEMRSEIINVCADGGCANVTDDRYAMVSVDQSNKPGPACTTPCTIQVKRNVELLATFTKSGYQPQTVKLGHAVSAAGGVGVAGNLIVGGVTGLVVDSVTGAGFDHVPNPLKVTLAPIAEAPKAARPRKRK